MHQLFESSNCQHSCVVIITSAHHIPYSTELQCLRRVVNTSSPTSATVTVNFAHLGNSLQTFISYFSSRSKAIDHSSSLSHAHLGNSLQTFISYFSSRSKAIDHSSNPSHALLFSSSIEHRQLKTPTSSILRTISARSRLPIVSRHLRTQKTFFLRSLLHAHASLVYELIRHQANASNPAELIRSTRPTASGRAESPIYGVDQNSLVAIEHHIRP